MNGRTNPPLPYPKRNGWQEGKKLACPFFRISKGCVRGCRWRGGYPRFVRATGQLAESEAGYLKTRRNDIFRLRRELIRVVGEETAAAFIETGGHDEYRLAIRRDEWKKKIGVSRCFFELIERGIVTEEQAKKVRRVARIMRRREY